MNEFLRAGSGADVDHSGSGRTYGINMWRTKRNENGATKLWLGPTK